MSNNKKKPLTKEGNDDRSRKLNPENGEHKKVLDHRSRQIKENKETKKK